MASQTSMLVYSTFTLVVDIAQNLFKPFSKIILFPHHPKCVPVKTDELQRYSSAGCHK